MSPYLVITGGSRGIGEKTIATFQEQGFKVINISRTPCALPDVINFHLDLADPYAIEKNIKPLQAVINNPSMLTLVHNAAYYIRDEVTSLSIDNLIRTLQINVVSAAALNKVFLPLMQTGSSIIYIGSTLSEKAVPGSASYVVSKHALIGLMRSTCQDLQGRPIHTCCICPGFVDTKMLHDNIDHATLKTLINQKVIAKRLIEPNEIAKVIHFCATSPVINGTVLHANLGQVAD